MADVANTHLQSMQAEKMQHGGQNKGPLNWAFANLDGLMQYNSAFDNFSATATGQLLTLPNTIAGLDICSGPGGPFNLPVTILGQKVTPDSARASNEQGLEFWRRWMGGEQGDPEQQRRDAEQQQGDPEQQRRDAEQQQGDAGRQQYSDARHDHDSAHDQQVRQSRGISDNQSFDNDYRNAHRRHDPDHGGAQPQRHPGRDPQQGGRTFHEQEKAADQDRERRRRAERVYKNSQPRR